MDNCYVFTIAQTFFKNGKFPNQLRARDIVVIPLDTAVALSIAVSKSSYYSYVKPSTIGSIRMMISFKSSPSNP